MCVCNCSKLQYINCSFTGIEFCTTKCSYILFIDLIVMIVCSTGDCALIRIDGDSSLMVAIVTVVMEIALVLVLTVIVLVVKVVILLVVAVLVCW